MYSPKLGMNKALIIFLVLFFSCGLTLSAQDTLSVKEQAEKNYQKRIQKEYLSRVYIPKDLADAFIQLNDLIDTESKKKFAAVEEAEAARKLHFSLGRWIIHNWGFYEGSRLSHYLRGIGLTYPDDMARFIIITYHRNLNKVALDVKPLIEGFKTKREEEFKKRKQEGQILEEKKIKKIPPHKSGQQ